MIKQLYMILCIPYILMIFIICQTIIFFPNICKPPHTKFCRHFLNNSEDNMSSVTFDVYFDL